jgi:hypothetical protein
MRVWVITIALVMACKSGKDKVVTAPPKTTVGTAVPTVSVATVLAKEEAKPPFLLLLDDTGAVRLAAAKTWADLDANTLKLGKKPTKPDSVDRYIREQYAMGRDPVESIAEWDEFSEVDLGSLEDTRTASGDSRDDPPPPPEEDGKDESGGTGTAMALDEGKMGKKDSDRAEGQYKMQKVPEDPQLARQQAIEAARAAGILGGGPSVDGGAVGHGIPNEDGTPSRAADIAGMVMRDGKLDRLRAMILVAPTVKAVTLIMAVQATDAAIAVSHDGKIRPLHLQFGLRDATDSPAWVEVRVSSKGLVVEAVPDKPLATTALDQLGAMLTTARTARGADADEPVDVLVDPDVDAQRLIDVVVALDTSGVKVIGMGGALTAAELARRGHRIPTTRLGQPNAQGNLDKAVIRKVIKMSKTKIAGCYEKALAITPTLAGTVQVQFFVKPDGTVATATAAGISPEVADCVAAVIKSLAFPKPKGGGGVQVNYPFTMRP